MLSASLNRLVRHTISPWPLPKQTYCAAQGTGEYDSPRRFVLFNYLSQIFQRGAPGFHGENA